MTEEEYYKMALDKITLILSLEISNKDKIKEIKQVIN